MHHKISESHIEYYKMRAFIRDILNHESSYGGPIHRCFFLAVFSESRICVRSFVDGMCYGYKNLWLPV